MSSGSSDSPKPVEFVTSANKIVTSLRSSDILLPLLAQGVLPGKIALCLYKRIIARIVEVCPAQTVSHTGLKGHRQSNQTPRIQTEVPGDALAGNIEPQIG